MIEGTFIRRTAAVTSDRVARPSKQAFRIALIATHPAMYVGGPSTVNVLILEYRSYSRTIERARSEKCRSGENTDTYPLRGMNRDGA